MGEYLSTPNKEKKSEEGENGKVNKYIAFYIFLYRCGTVFPPCKDGAEAWKTHTFPTWILEMALRYLVSSTVMEVS